MNNMFRVFLTIIFIALGGFFVYMFYISPASTPQEEDTSQLVHTVIRIKSNSTPQGNGEIKLHRSGYYSIKQEESMLRDDANIERVPVQFICGDFSLITKAKSKIFKVPLYIESPCTLSIKFLHRYKENQDLKVRIRELERAPRKYNVPVTKKKYSKFNFSVKKGMELELYNNEELVYIGYFKNNKRVDRKLLSRSYQNQTLQFWSDYIIKFKAAEVPSLLTISGGLYIKKLKINNVGNGDVLYLNNRESTKTKIWLDQGDKIKIFTGEFYLGTENESFVHERKYVCKKAGFLRIRAVRKAIVEKINVERKKRWRFKLQPGQVGKRIKVFAGDRISFSSGERFFINETLQNIGGWEMSITAAKTLVFKGSTLATDVQVKILQRRGI